MPQFIMPISEDVKPAWDRLDSFVQGYIEAAFFTIPEEDDLQDAEFGEIANTSLKQIIRDCEDFQAEAAALLDAAYESGYDYAQAGRDFWFSRNGHGTGFWDRQEIPEHTGKALSAVAHGFDPVDMYRGDRGLIHFQ